jgi:hypothetical protein
MEPFMRSHSCGETKEGRKPPALVASDWCRGWGLRVLRHRPYMATGPAAQIPRLYGVLGGERQYIHIDAVLALWARKRSDGDIRRHDVQPFYRVVKAARQYVRRSDRGGQLSEGDLPPY